MGVGPTRIPWVSFGQRARRCDDLKTFIFSILIGVSLTACVIQDEVKDGLWEMRTKVSTATLMVEGDRTGTLDFTFEYLLGLVDDQGIEEVQWAYRLVDPDGQDLVSETEVMRQAQLDEKEVFVQGERPRQLTVESPVLTAEATYVLWITVRYREQILAELLVPVSQGTPHLDEDLTDDIPQFSTR